MTGDELQDDEVFILPVPILWLQILLPLFIFSIINYLGLSNK